MRYLTQSRKGLCEEVLQYTTVRSYVEHLFTALEEEAGLERFRLSELRVELGYFLSELAEEGQVSTNSREKPLTHDEDLTFIMSMLSSPEHLAKFQDMRTPLNLALWLLLMVDVCGRGSELAWHSTRPKHMCLRWGDIEFLNFQSKDDEVFDIRANVKVQWIKGQSKNKSEFRQVPFAGILPPDLATEDTLRLLLIVALMDDVLDGNIKTWTDLSRLRLPSQVAENGRRIPIRRDMRDVPVLRIVTRQRLTTAPANVDILRGLVSSLGKICGFEYDLTAYSIRRGVGRVLDENVNEGTARSSWAKEIREHLSPIDLEFLPSISPPCIAIWSLVRFCHSRASR